MGGLDPFFFFFLLLSCIPNSIFRNQSFGALCQCTFDVWFAFQLLLLCNRGSESQWLHRTISFFSQFGKNLTGCLLLHISCIIALGVGWVHNYLKVSLLWTFKMSHSQGSQLMPKDPSRVESFTGHHVGPTQVLGFLTAWLPWVVSPLTWWLRAPDARIPVA